MDKALLSTNTKKITKRTILAADESTGSIKKKLATVSIESNPETNRQYRQLLFTTPGIEQYVSGVIMYDETIRQSTDEGVSFPKFLQTKNIVSGIKVDKGTVPLSTSSDDVYTQGLDGLSERLEEYRSLGALFAKWRAVFKITTTSPSQMIINRNAADLAAYALLCQQANIVPIVEPEVLRDGDHSLEKNKEVTIKVLTAVFQQLRQQNVYLEGIILKPNMITNGSEYPQQADTQQIAQQTLEVLKQLVPSSVAIAFLSGGQGPNMATANLNEINKIKNNNSQEFPWRLTASYGRALEDEALHAWSGNKNALSSAQQIFLERAQKVYQASLGTL